MSLDPEGRAYVTYSYDKDNKYVSLIRLRPGGELGGKYPYPSHEVIAKLRENAKGSDLNAGTYLEEGGVPYVIVSTGFGRGDSKKVNLNTEAVEK